MQFVTSEIPVLKPTVWINKCNSVSSLSSRICRLTPRCVAMPHLSAVAPHLVRFWTVEIYFLLNSQVRIPHTPHSSDLSIALGHLYLHELPLYQWSQGLCFPKLCEVAPFEFREALYRHIILAFSHISDYRITHK